MELQGLSSPLRSTIVVIPALDPDPVLPAYVRELLEQGAEQVVTVDDGSGPDFAPTFGALSALDR